MNSDVSVFFTDGHVVSKDYVLVAAKLNSLADEYFSRCFYFRGGQWGRADITDSVHSVTHEPDSDSALWLGLAGKVTITVPGKRITQVIPDVARLGNVNRIRNVAGEFYVCGYGGQVYKRRGESWVHHDSGLLIAKPDATSLDLKDIGGTGSDDLYAVGTGGAIWYYDGVSWVQLDSPTNVHLKALKCVSRDEVYVCGNRGTVLRGNHLGWTAISGDTEATDFYGIELFDDEIYVSGMDKLVKVTGTALAPVDIAIDNDRPLTFHRLHANDGVLWSFGTDHLLYFDGLDWHFVPHPDNS